VFSTTATTLGLDPNLLAGLIGALIAAVVQYFRPKTPAPVPGPSPAPAPVPPSTGRPWLDLLLQLLRSGGQPAVAKAVAEATPAELLVVQRAVADKLDAYRAVLAPPEPTRPVA
jgi:hypothetical protein